MRTPMLRPIVVMALGPMVAVLVVDAATVMALVVHLTATRCRQMARTSPAAKSASGTHRQHVLVSLPSLLQGHTANMC
jgi:hypothetical protein